MSTGRLVSLAALWLWGWMGVCAARADSGGAEAEPPLRSVLLLHSYNPHVQYTSTQDREIVRALSGAPDLAVTVIREYMLDLNVDDAASVEALTNLLRIKYANLPFDLVITTDTPAALFWFARGESVKPGVPMVFSGLRDTSLGEMPPGGERTGVLERLDIIGTLELMRTLHPGARTLGVIDSAGHTNEWRSRSIAEAIEQGPAWDRVEWIRDVGREAVLSRVRALPEDAVLLLAHVSGTPEEINMAARFFPEMNGPEGRPLYALYDGNIKGGCVGGMVASAEMQGAAAGALALRVLRGERASSIPIVTKSPNAVLFNGPAADRWELDRRAFPAGTIVVGDPPTFWERYHPWIVSGLLVAAGAAGATVVILGARRGRRIAEATLAHRTREARRHIENLLGSAAGVLGARDDRAVAEEVALAVRRAGWGRVAVYLYDAELNIDYVAADGLTPGQLAAYQNCVLTPAQRRALFEGLLDPYRVSRSYFVPGEAARRLGIPGVLALGARPGAPEAGSAAWLADDMAVVPLIGGDGGEGRVIGAMSLGAPDDGLRPDAEKFRPLEFFADLAGRTIDSLALVRRANAAAAEARAAREILSQLLSDAALLHGAGDEAAILRAVAESVRRTGWECVTVYSYDDAWSITQTAYAGLTPEMIEYLETHRLTPERRAEMFGPSMARFRLSRSFFVPTEHVPELKIPFEILPGRRTARPGDTWEKQDLAYIPLRTPGGKIVGRITLDDPADGQRPTEAQYRRIEFFADLAARAIENRRLDAAARAADEAVRLTAEQLRGVVNNTPLILWGVDREGRVTLSEGAGLAALGLKPGEVVGRNVYELYPELPEVREHLGRALAGEALHASTRLGELYYDTHFAPRRDAEGRIVGVISVSMDVSALKQTERELRRQVEVRRLLLAELDHRVKNALAGLLTMIDLSRERREEDLAAAIRAHIQAMLAVHSMLSSEHWTGVDLADLIRAMLPQGAGDRVMLEGPPVRVPARQATALGMVVQELAINARKHGALGAAGGRVLVRWDAPATAPSGDRALVLQWHERGGPPPRPDPSPGTGTQLVQGFASFELKGSIEWRYPPEGASHVLRARLDAADGSRDPSGVARLAPEPAAVG